MTVLEPGWRDPLDQTAPDDAVQTAIDTLLRALEPLGPAVAVTVGRSGPAYRAADAPRTAPAHDVSGVTGAVRWLGPADQPPADDGDAPGVVVDLSERSVTVAGDTVRLTYLEFNLLVALLDRAGTVVSRTELLDRVWGPGKIDPASRTLDVHVRRLRGKTGLQHEIVTVRGTGYLLAPSRRLTRR